MRKVFQIKVRNFKAFQQEQSFASDSSRIYFGSGWRRRVFFLEIGIRQNSNIKENQIDLMIYKLYNLTYEEVKIVEPDFAMSEKDYDKFKI